MHQARGPKGWHEDTDGSSWTERPNWHREERRLIADCRDADDCCIPDACRLDAHRLLPHIKVIQVPEDVLSGLVNVARWVASERERLAAQGRHIVLPDATAKRALAALDDAGLLEQFREE